MSSPLDLLGRIDTCFKQQAEQAGYHGGTLAVVQDGQTVLTSTAGVSDLERGSCLATLAIPAFARRNRRRCVGFHGWFRDLAASSLALVSTATAWATWSAVQFVRPRSLSKPR